jgi:hypothetical protein
VEELRFGLAEEPEAFSGNLEDAFLKNRGRAVIGGEVVEFGGVGAVERIALGPGWAVALEIAVSAVAAIPAAWAETASVTAGKSVFPAFAIFRAGAFGMVLGIVR